MKAAVNLKHPISYHLSPTKLQLTGMLCERCQTPVPVDSRIIQPIDSRFLRSDYVLSDEERLRINQLLKEENRRLQDYEEEIMRTRQRLAVLEEEKRNLEGNILRRRSALSILRSLPVEIWEIIFASVCSSSHNGQSLIIECSYWRRSPLLVMPPLVLSHVCSSWRAIALGSPKLWSSIRIAYDKIPASFYQLFETFVKRSEGWSLDLEIVSGPVEPSDRPPHVLAFWKLIAENLLRCRAFTYGVRHCDPLYRAPPIADVSFPNLTSFRCTAHKDKIDSTHWFWQALSRAPKLSIAETFGPYPLDTLPYSQLTTLIIRPLFNDESLDDFFQVLQVSRNLRHLTLQIDDSDALSDELEMDHFPVVSIPCLTNLIVNIQATALDAPFMAACLRAMYHSLLMPSLVTLKLECPVKNTASWPDSLLVMLQRCSSLQRLSLCWRGCYEPDFHPQKPLSKILQVTPNLTHFVFHLSTTHLIEQGISEAKETFNARVLLSSFFSELQHPPSSSSLLPKPRSLSLRLRGTVMDDSMLEDLLGAAMGRKASNLPLGSIRVQRFVEKSEPTISVEPELFEKMESLEQDGVSVTIEDTTEVWQAFEGEDDWS
ncbi:hypothetical protein L218DRAFT_1075458 [Marasmius fiardii PR-910]|nr:hypothetical protein L218DRAFT_1075458 [Marasmius fiardii PR-910]